jgi:shikimate dehydrogenase
MKAGLLGYPIDHSLSPAIHNAAYAALGLDWEYALYPCEDRSAFLRTLAAVAAEGGAETFVGFNVTTPYKVDAWEACATHSPACALLGSANVLTLPVGAAPEQPLLHGDNTDGRGLVATLERDAGVEIAASSVVICGTGPVAFAALLSLIEKRAASVSLVSRDPNRARARLEDFCVFPAPTAVRAIGYGEVPEALASADILIDATTVGMNPGDDPVVPPAALRPGLVVFDAVYGHGETALIRGAREVGATALDGLGMLIEQAALTIEIWMRARGIHAEAPRDIMRQAALQTTVSR